MRISDWSSDVCSSDLASRGEFLTRIAKVTARHLVGSVPRPPHWTGFCLDPQRMEFWMDRPFRLHDRRQFTRSGGGWTSTLLYPCDRKSVVEGKSVSVRVDLGGGRIIKKKKTTK